MSRFAACVAAFLIGSIPALAGELPKFLTNEDFRTYPDAQVKLGQLLFYDRILSGTYRVSCATCHNHDRASSNGVRLDGKEEERDDLAVNGEPIYEPFKPSAKHAPVLFNLGARQFTRMFSDGRVALLAGGSFLSPAGNELPEGLNDVLAVQALFPALEKGELVGSVESDVSTAAHIGNTAIWDVLAKRISDTEEYWPYFKTAFPELDNRKQINIVHIANAIGAFVGSEWRSDDAPFDRLLKGDSLSMNRIQVSGMTAFYGAAGCSKCHAGALQTDHQLHFVADAKTRTPSLRNVLVTPPYGADGSFGDLAGFLTFHAPGISSETRFELLAFLNSLTDERGLRGVLGKPLKVPSSLALD